MMAIVYLCLFPVKILLLEQFLRNRYYYLTLFIIITYANFWSSNCGYLPNYQNVQRNEFSFNGKLLLLTTGSEQKCLHYNHIDNTYDNFQDDCQLYEFEESSQKYVYRSVNSCSSELILSDEGDTLKIYCENCDDTARKEIFSIQADGNLYGDEELITDKNDSEKTLEVKGYRSSCQALIKI